ncbi:hypothetical protein BD626DRAFT_189990 [Schizophyllum amplum]|uniref:Calpain catalytic domain-containing protein n=1 Tax=Schizophyllum amplum TaxID=97359 RepID=A0A550BZZ0_9AGAR|nr:hypothetical protein BD626DRAFT_189990 [Auriculariopsis ampla]
MGIFHFFGRQTTPKGSVASSSRSRVGGSLMHNAQSESRPRSLGEYSAGRLSPSSSLSRSRSSSRSSDYEDCDSFPSANLLPDTSEGTLRDKDDGRVSLDEEAGRDVVHMSSVVNESRAASSETLAVVALSADTHAPSAINVKDLSPKSQTPAQTISFSATETRITEVETHVTEVQISADNLTPASITTLYRAQDEAGQLVTGELDKAREKCRTRVREIAAECRAANRRFRDIDFDLEDDRMRCLHGLSLRTEKPYAPSDVQRVTQIFDQPRFFGEGGPDSGDIVQSDLLGDCWFLSALSTSAAMPGLVDRFCVERDEAVGVYGFIFFRDNAWVPVIIDDLLFTAIPKFEDLLPSEKLLYHNDLETYNRSARKGGRALYFARSGQQDVTWVSLIEKAYAKLHGDYSALVAGWDGEAIEDLTGGVASTVQIKDILDPDRFWTDELCRANMDRLFAASFASPDDRHNGNTALRSTGLLSDHSYSVLRIVEARGKRFLVLRNPWGESEWTGPWSDGSREWTQEWLEVLPQLGHRFGDDGEFVMEYKDFLQFYARMDRTLLFDSRWVMASHWMHVPTRALPSAVSYGDVSFTISVPARTAAVIVLSRVNERYFMDLRGCYDWNLDFLLFKKGSRKCVGRSVHTAGWKKSVSLEIELDAGDYVVHVRADKKLSRDKNFIQDNFNIWEPRKLSRILMERAKSYSLASNFNVNPAHFPIPEENIAGQDLASLEEKALRPPTTLVTTTTTTVSKSSTGEMQETTITTTEEVPAMDKPYDAVSVVSSRCHNWAPTVIDSTDDVPLVLGLKVYTNKDAPAVVDGQERHEPTMTLQKDDLALVD